MSDIKILKVRITKPDEKDGMSTVTVTYTDERGRLLNMSNMCFPGTEKETRRVMFEHLLGDEPAG